MTIVILARHGETDWNRESRWQGWADPPLNDLGRRQAAELAERLRDVPFDAVYTSDLRRAHETAEIVAAPHGVPVVTDPGLREIDVGSWSGLTKAEIDERFGGERPDGETHEQHRERVRAAAARLVAAHPDARILLVCHGGTMRALAETFEGPIENCAVIELRWADGRLVAA
ncbi:MAG TPA: histidine phosphatase family protein [Gaiellaceae bacterium]|nr:histidine phosphatase family protein [Gaiellaceae bacterium]